jgi:hypothetical protein
MFEEDEFRNNIAISAGRRIAQRCFLMEAPHDPVQRFIGQVIGMFAIFAIEISRQSPTHFQVTHATAIAAFIQPAQELLESLFRRSPGSNLLKPWNDLPRVAIKGVVD